MGNQKGFIQIPLLIAIIVGILVLGGGGYYGVKKYQNYQAEKIKKEVATQAEIDGKQKAQDETQLQKDLELEILKKEVEALKNKKPQVIQQTIVKEVTAPKTEKDLPSIIQQWRPKVAYVLCEWRYSDTNNVQARASGSGILINMTDSKDGPMMVVLTNKHVLFLDDQFTPRSCDISLPGMGNTFHLLDQGEFYAFRKSSLTGTPNLRHIFNQD
ncbi:hypothetical protein HYZ82_02400 [Candidatus Nomurabacteria bacterium]|nr:hypothetical protein [Candidatus Nomurabacteria bacterium]